jgi:hypothetical protein
VVSFLVDLDGLSLRLRVEAAPSVPRARRLRVEVGSGTGVNVIPNAGLELPQLCELPLSNAVQEAFKRLMV